MNVDVLDLMDKFLTEVRTEKRASIKQATDPSKPTTHPVMDADDGTMKAREGARSAENKGDAADTNSNVSGQEDANSVDGKDPADSIGTQKMEAGEVKGNVAHPKSGKDKPQESSGHPSNSTFSEKYSSFSAAAALGADLLAELEKQSSHEEGCTEEQGLSKEAAAEQYREDAEAGYAAACHLAEQLGFSKSAEAETAQTQVAQSVVESIIKSAEEDAERYVQFLAGHIAGLNKVHMKRAGEPDGDEQPGEGAPMSNDAMAAGSAEETASDEAGNPHMMGGEGGEGGGADEHLEQLAQALQEAGVTPEELAQAIQQIEAEHGGGGGEAPGGMPPGMPGA
jgi:hypothetical protein